MKYCSDASQLLRDKIVALFGESLCNHWGKWESAAPPRRAAATDLVFCNGNERTDDKKGRVKRASERGKLIIIGRR